MLKEKEICFFIFPIYIPVPGKLVATVDVLDVIVVQKVLQVVEEPLLVDGDLMAHPGQYGLHQEVLHLEQAYNLYALLNTHLIVHLE